MDEFRSYDRTDLIARLRSMGIGEGDTILLQSAFEASSGFKGSPGDVADAVLEVVPTKKLHRALIERDFGVVECVVTGNEPGIESPVGGCTNRGWLSHVRMSDADEPLQRGARQNPSQRAKNRQAARRA